MKLISLITAIAVLATAAVASAQAPLREYEGRVVSVNRDAKHFRLHDSERGTVRVHVNRNTRFERIAGMAGLRVGMRRVEVKVRRIDGRWIASEVEKSGGGGEHGGGDRRDRGDRGGGDRGGGGGNSGPGS
jgi:uncharacterized membrane protein YgcG